MNFQIPLNMLEEVKKISKRETHRATLDLKKGSYPINTNFPCPFCGYESKKNKQGSARIYSDKEIFKCFACSIERKVNLKNGDKESQTKIQNF